MSTHQQLLDHIVFSTKLRKPDCRNDDFREEVFTDMAGTTKGLGGFALNVGGYHVHAHLLVRIPAKIAVSTFVGQLKASTSKHTNQTSGVLQKFGWQDGYGAFTVSLSQKDRVCHPSTGRSNITVVNLFRMNICGCWRITRWSTIHDMYGIEGISALRACTSWGARLPGLASPRLTLYRACRP